MALSIALWSGGSQAPCPAPQFSADVEGAKKTFRIAELRHPEKRKLFDGDHIYRPKEGDVADWPSLLDAEIVLLHYWVDSRLPFPRFDHKTGWLSCGRRSVFNLYESFNPLLARYYIDNLFEALTEPGEWHLDSREGRLIYLPVEDEVLGQTEVVAPLLKRFISVRGRSYLRSQGILEPHISVPVEDLIFEGLCFEHSDWHTPIPSLLRHDEGAPAVEDLPMGSAPQAAHRVPAVISFGWSRGCGLRGCRVRLTGFSAVEFGPGCRSSFLERRSLLDLGGGGVKIEGSELDGPVSDQTSGITVQDSVIDRIGRVFHQSVGVLLTTASACRILHNEIAHTCYTGISCGWSWSYRHTVTQNNLIEGNLIHDICEGMLSDNGGIYLLGVQPGTVVRGNRIFRVTAADYGGWGIYPDEGSSHLVIEQNWIHDTGGCAISIHYGRENLVRDNLLADAGDAFFCVGKQEDWLSAQCFSNIFAGKGAAPFTGPYRGDIRKSLRSDRNVFAPKGDLPWAALHPDYREDVDQQIDWEAWREAGNDRGSVHHSSGWEDLEEVIQAAEKAVGFRRFDWTTCGPRPKAGAPEGSPGKA